MLVDEPTPALDPKIIKGLLDLTKTLAREGMPMVVVTDEMGFAWEVATEQFFRNPSHPRTKLFLSKIL